MTDIILFSGPWIRGTGCLDHRIVLHAHYVEGKPVEFIVHAQYRKQDGTLGYDSGDYYLVRFYGEQALTQAMNKFWTRCLDKYNLNTRNFIVETH